MCNPNSTAAPSAAASSPGKPTVLRGAEDMNTAQGVPYLTSVRRAPQLPGTTNCNECSSKLYCPSQPEWRKQYTSCMRENLVKVADQTVFQMHPLLMNGDCGFAAIARGLNLHAVFSCATAEAVEAHLCASHGSDISDGHEQSNQNTFFQSLRLGLSAKLLRTLSHSSEDSAKDSTKDSAKDSSCFSIDPTSPLTSENEQSPNDIHFDQSASPICRSASATSSIDSTEAQLARDSPGSSTSSSKKSRAASNGTDDAPQKRSRSYFGNLFSNAPLPARNRSYSGKRKGQQSRRITSKDVRRIMADEVRANIAHYVNVSCGLVTANQLDSLVRNVERSGLAGFWLGSEAGILEFIALSRALSVRFALYCFDVPSQSIRRFEEISNPNATCEICLLFTGPAASGHFDLLMPVASPEQSQLCACQKCSRYPNSDANFRCSDASVPNRGGTLDGSLLTVS